jgi:ABC-type uncharacterized transport system involved in gliding motility auxiliary subunit
MSTESSTSPRGSAVTLFGIIGWLGTIAVMASVAIRFVRPEWQQYQQYLAWGGLALILVYLAGQWRDVQNFYQGRSARYGTLSIVSVLVFVGILFAINYLSARQNKRWDLTANQVYALSDQTVKILQGLDAPVKFTVFDEELSFDRYRDRLDEYAYQSSLVSAEYVDPIKNPVRANAAKVTSLGTILIDYKDRTERVTGSGEQELTNALIKAVTGATRKVYFTQGHGEKDPESSERTGFSAVAQALEADNYGVEKIVLAQKGAVPDDATVLVIAGPQTDFLQPEIDAVKQYMARGGKVLALVDPQTDPGSAGKPNLTAFIHDWAMSLGDDVVLDASGIGRLLGTDASVPVAANYPPHPITTNFELMTAFPLARSVTPVEGGVNGRTAQSIVETGPQSWAEVDLAGLAKGDGRVELNPEDGDRPGPISLGAAVSAPAAEPPAAPAADPSAEKPAEPATKPESRVVTIGDSDFASNSVIGVQGNRDFFMNTINWLAQQENLIAIRPKEPEDRRLTLTADAQSRLMMLSLLIIPGLVFAAGVYNWYRRR